MAEPRPPASIVVEVAWAEPHRQVLRRLELPAGATVAEALRVAGLETGTGTPMAGLDTGIWSKRVPRDTVLADGDRVELYRPLALDPKEARRRRGGTGAATRRREDPGQPPR
jgi:putative ubiquitin-RnfH superfamily antitoxin RatB of RatAB toxin-antitoxin module